MKKRHEQKLVVLAIGLFIIFNAPIVIIIGRPWTILGFPAFYIFTFGFWLLSIVLSYIIMMRYYD